MQVWPWLITHPQRTPGAYYVSADDAHANCSARLCGLIFCETRHLVDVGRYIVAGFIKNRVRLLLTPFIPTIRSDAIVIEFAIQNVPAHKVPLR